jgi:predicted RNA-binding Zn ribbon-like protein
LTDASSLFHVKARPALERWSARGRARPAFLADAPTSAAEAATIILEGEQFFARFAAAAGWHPGARAIFDLMEPPAVPSNRKCAHCGWLLQDVL